MKRFLNLVRDKSYFLIAISLISMMFMYIPVVNNVARKMTVIFLLGSTLIVILLNWNNVLLEIRKRKDSWIYISFCLFYLGTIIVNRNHNFLQNFKALVWMVIYFFLVYLWQEKSQEDYIRKIIIINRILIVCNFIFVLIGDVMLFLDLNFSVLFGRPIGVDSGRLFGVYLEINSGCILTLCMILSSYVNFYLEKQNRKNGTWNKFYVINGVLCYIFLIAAKSRTALICFCVSCAIIACSHAYKFLLADKVIKRVLIYILVAMITLGVAYGFVRISDKIISGGVYTTRVIKEKIESGRGSESAEIGKFERTDEAKSLLARVQIWNEGVQLWEEVNPLLGIGQANMKYYAETSERTEIYQHLKSGQYGEATHNALVSVLFASGGIGLVHILVLWSIVLWKGIMLFLKGQHLQNLHLRGIFVGELCIVVTLLLYGLMFTALVFSNIFETVFFWWYFGLISRLLNSKSLKEMEKT